MQHRTRLISLVLFVATVVGLSPAIAEARPTFIDVTIRETVPLTSGALVAGSIPGCAGPSVDTGPVTVTERPRRRAFAGSKTINCADGSTISLDFRVSRRGCADTNFGRWRVTGGTGAFADARGGGRLIGSYTDNAPGGDPTCGDDLIDDRYIGRIRL